MSPKNPEEVTQAIEEALQSEGLIITRETDLEAVNHYLNTQRVGCLHVVIGEGDERVESDIECTYAQTPMGEYILRWAAESIEDVLTNGETYLMCSTLTSSAHQKVFFSKSRELFFGETKAFVICTPSHTRMRLGLGEKTNG